MSATIESLELEVESNAKQAVSGIESLSNSLNKLKNALKGNGLDKLNEKLESITNANLNADGVKKLSNLTKSLEKLNQVKISSTIEKHIKGISEAIAGIDPAAIQNVSALSTALQGLNGLKISNLNSVTRNLKNNTFASEVTPNVTQTQNVTAAATPMLTGATQYTSQMSQYTSSVNNATAATTRFRSAVSKIGSVIRNAFGKSRTWVTKFGDALKRIPTLATQTMSAFRSMGNIMSNVFGNSVGRLTSGLGKLFNSLKRIAFYRAIRWFFSELTSAVKEGINNVYEYSDVMGGRFKTSMDSLTSSFNYLKNSIGAAVAPLIDALAPAIDTLIDKFVSLLNVVNAFFARLSGASSYTVAVKGSNSYASSISTLSLTMENMADEADNGISTLANLSEGLDTVGDDASDAAKKIKDATLGFDELNMITVPEDTSSGSGSSGSGSGSSGSGSGSGYSFETIEIDSGISDFVDSLMEAFENGDWEALGTLLGEKFNQIIEDIDWVGIGSKIGYGINGAIQTAYYFLKEADFITLGRHVAEMINAAMDEINFEDIGRLIIRAIESAIEFVASSIGNLDWGGIATSISDFFVGIFSEIGDWFEEIDWSNAAEVLYEDIRDFILNLRWADIGQAFWDALSDAITAAIEFTGSFDDSFSQDVEDTMERIDTYVGGAKLALGAILALSGVNRGLGLALLAQGALDIVEEAALNWGVLENDVTKGLALIRTALDGFMIVLGILLVAVTGQMGLGIALIAMGASDIVTSLTTNWGVLSDDVAGGLQMIMALVDGAAIAIGLILVMSGAMMPLGIALIAMGALGIVTEVAVNWSGTSSKVSTMLSTITAIASVAVLALGVILLLTGAGLPLGIGLIAAGAIGLVSTMAANWSSIVSYVKQMLQQVGIIAGAMLLALGVILCLTAAFMPLGIALIAAGAASLVTGIGLNWDTIKNGVKKGLQAVANVFGNFKDWVGEKLQGAKETIQTWAGNVKEFFTKGDDGSNLLDKIKTIAGEWGDKFKEGISTKFENAKSWVSQNILEPVTNALENSKAVEFAVKVKDTATEWWSNVKEWWSNETEDGVTLQSFVELVKKGWETILGWIGNIPVIGQFVELLKQGWDTVMDLVGNIPVIGQFVELLKQGWETILGWIGDVPTLDQLIALARDGWTSVAQKIKDSWLGSTVSKAIGIIRDGWTSVAQKIKDSWLGDAVDKLIGLGKDGWTTVADWVKDRVGGAVSVTINLIKGWAGTLKNWLGLSDGGVIGANGSIKAYASGGIIPAYASGTSGAHGSMFLAGESGAELVGHVNGTTEVLNRFQLATIMQNAIINGMARFEVYWQTMANQQIECANGIINGLAVDTDTMIAALQSNSTYDPTKSLSDSVYEDTRRACKDMEMDETMARVMKTWYQNYMEPTLKDIAADTKRQADKEEQTIIKIGNRDISDAVTEQKRANGYSFIGA